MLLLCDDTVISCQRWFAVRCAVCSVTNRLHSSYLELRGGGVHLLLGQVTVVVDVTQEVFLLLTSLSVQLLVNVQLS